LLPVPLPRAAGLLYLLASGLALALWHSGNVVHGVLQRSRLLPSAVGGGLQGARAGRIIGYLERILIVVLVLKGSYEGMGFLIAAKGSSAPGNSRTGGWPSTSSWHAPERRLWACDRDWSPVRLCAPLVSCPAWIEPG